MGIIANNDGQFIANGRTYSGLTQLSPYGDGLISLNTPTAGLTEITQPDGGSNQQEDPSVVAARQAAQQEAARKAAEEAQKTGLRSGISSLIDQALGVYDTLYGNVRGAAQSQRGALEKRNLEETSSLTDQFNVELPKIGKAYAARGLADSSYRQGAEGVAGKQFQNQLTGLSTQMEADKAKIGAELAAEEAQFATDKSLLGLTRGRLGEVTDLQDLLDTRSEIERKIAELQGKVQAGGTQESYAQRFNQLAPSAGRLQGLQQTLSNIIQGQAPGALKKAVATQIIGSSGLPEEEKAQLTAQVTQMIG